MKRCKHCPRIGYNEDNPYVELRRRVEPPEEWKIADWGHLKCLMGDGAGIKSVPDISYTFGVATFPQWQAHHILHELNIPTEGVDHA